jgi:putative ABC transport system permease protein
MKPPPDPSYLGLFFAFLPLLGCMVILAVRGLGQVRPMTIALVRLCVQLSLLASILRWVFAHQSGGLVTGVALVMLLFSAQTVGSRDRKSGFALKLEAFGAMGVGLVIVMAVAIKLSLGLEPWYPARVVIPLLGMVLGNSVSAVSLATERFESELRSERDRVELRLALGATSRQAALPALRAAIRAALTPVINNMMIAGVVAIPGMSTGQILSGMDVGTAFRYQVLVYFGITATVTISILILLSIRLRRAFTPARQLRHERLAETTG